MEKGGDGIKSGETLFPCVYERERDEERGEREDAMAEEEEVENSINMRAQERKRGKRRG